MSKNPLAHPADPTPRSGGARDTDAPGKAILCALAGGAVLTLNDSIVKSLSSEYPIGQVLAVRGAFIFIPLLIFALRAGGIHTLWQIKNWKGQALRGVCVIGSAFFFVAALTYLPLADAIAIAFAGPLFVTALAPVLLSERVGWRRWAAVLFGFSGVLLIVQPGSTSFQWYAVFPLMACFLGGMRDIITRKMAPTESTVAVLFVTTMCVGLAGCVTFPFTDWKPIPGPHVLYFLASGLLVGIAHYLIIESFRHGEAALVSPFKYANVIWASLLGYLMFDDVPGSMTIAGALVVSASGVYILHRERIRSRGKNEDSS